MSIKLLNKYQALKNEDGTITVKLFDNRNDNIKYALDGVVLDVNQYITINEDTLVSEYHPATKVLGGYDTNKGFFTLEEFLKLTCTSEEAEYSKQHYWYCGKPLTKFKGVYVSSDERFVDVDIEVVDASY